MRDAGCVTHVASANLAMLSSRVAASLFEDICSRLASTALSLSLEFGCILRGRASVSAVLESNDKLTERSLKTPEGVVPTAQ